ncbi:DH domain-containing protein [Mycena kentingensis (nom. inval.)]|nr:DH domain-containing protein [Mycena kentingensis (nom. inval.)]
MSALRWSRYRLKPLPTTPDVGDSVDDSPRAVPPTPGFKPAPPSIAQLAMPSPDEASTSSSSHETPPPAHLAKYDPAASRSPKKLRKQPPSHPPTSYPFSFIPEEPRPAPNFNFPFNFYSSTPPSPASSYVSSPDRALSVFPRASRKLTKRRPALTNVSAPNLVDPPSINRRNTFNFSLRRNKSSVLATQSEDGHSYLPSLPPPSPLHVNIPTFQSFHARRRDSWHVEPPSESNTHPTPPTTETLSEIAYTGVAPKGFATRGGWRSTMSLTDSDANNRPKPKFTIGDELERSMPSSSLSSRPPLIRRDAVTASPKRRWTLAMALTDEAISDEILVEKLEALRSRSRSRAASLAASDNADDDPDDWERVWEVCKDELDAIDLPPPPVPPKDVSRALPRPPPLPSPSSMPNLPSPPTPSWQSARRALLTCRELVRTERHFLSSLQSLLAGETRQIPPPLMRAYAATLAKESAKLLRRMEDDPSAWGVGAAFLGMEETLEPAFVSWCGVVGTWFVDGSQTQTQGSKRLSKSRSRVASDPGVDEEGGAFASMKSVSWRRSSASPRPASSLSISLNMTPMLTESPQASPTSGSFSANTSRARSRRERDARPAVRDLAILPTQRVMRYVLLYRDLLEHTPARSPARPLVAQAVDVAVRMAQRCDRAQGNAAFLQASRRHGTLTALIYM